MKRTDMTPFEVAAIIEKDAKLLFGLVPTLTTATSINVLTSMIMALENISDALRKPDFDKKPTV